ncbi:MAG: hypothetical protein GY804_03625 [Alphaproteobacteria bacterium]|nr:hypothetical protein [Alphaproteobacteria bacterium]
MARAEWPSERYTQLTRRLGRDQYYCNLNKTFVETGIDLIMTCRTSRNDRIFPTKKGKLSALEKELEKWIKVKHIQSNMFSAIPYSRIFVQLQVHHLEKLPVNKCRAE